MTVDDAGPRREERLLSGLRGALIQIRDAADLDDLLTAAGRLVVRRCGFDRCIVFVVEDGELVAHAVDFGDRVEWAEEVLQLGRSPAGRQHLDPGLVEAEMVRRRMAAIIPDAQNDSATPRALVAATQTRSYVAAPILCEGRAIAFLHADHHFKQRAVDDIDRETIAALATGVGLAVDRVVLHSHLLRQQRLAQDLEARLHRFSGDLLQVDVAAALRPASAPGVDVRDVAPHQAVRNILSLREIEVLELLAAGATNAEIARRLVVAEGTAKAHVHRILRKLGVRNRAEAVARWMSA